MSGLLAKIFKTKSIKVHSESEEAEASNNKRWYRKGLLHRDDGPAVELPDGTKEWWVNGKRHRDDGPAMICANGSRSWWQNGLLHRDNGPAMIHGIGAFEWYKNGKLHREDGPAVEWPEKDLAIWYLDGQRCEESSFTKTQKISQPSEDITIKPLPKLKRSPPRQ